ASARLQLADARGIPEERRPHRVAHRIHGAARLSLGRHGRDPRGARRRRSGTYISVIRDLLDSLFGQGFRRIAVVNGHGGNSFAAGVMREWLTEPRKERVQVLFHDWWNAPRAWAVVQRYEKESSHGSWMENFPWTRLKGVTMPKGVKP